MLIMIHFEHLGSQKLSKSASNLSDVFAPGTSNKHGRSRSVGRPRLYCIVSKEMEGEGKRDMREQEIDFRRCHKT